MRRREALAAGLGMAAAAGLPAARAAGRRLHIGYQKYGTLVLLKERGDLGKRLPDLEIAWTEFPGGPQLLEALNVGAIDFGTTGEAPPVFAQAAGAPLLYVGYEPPAPKGEAILVPKDSPIGAVTDLKGRKVALNKGSNVHYLLVRALEANGLSVKDIQPVYLPPADARAAFERGAVDAWVIWDPFLAAAQAATGARTLRDGTGLVDNHQFFLASRGFAAKDPDTLHVILEELDAADRWAQGSQKDVAKLLSPRVGIPAPVLETALARIGYGVGPVTEEVVAKQQKIADTFHAAGLIPKPISIRDAVWKAAA
jgi:sulfonate transport system substrate-binding protein